MTCIVLGIVLLVAAAVCLAALRWQGRAVNRRMISVRRERSMAEQRLQALTHATLREMRHVARRNGGGR